MIALDLFAGAGGWSVACRRLGVVEYGVELMREAVATRDANGFSTVYEDVWDGLEGGVSVPDYDLLIASPPCQTFSLAGKGAGRVALDDVLGAVRSGLFADPAALRRFGGLHDPRTALVLTPLTYVFRDRPLFVALEQVPPVLPVWLAYADVLRGWGYSVWAGNLQAEQFGVPQTRKRAFLVARRDGVVAGPPVPSHSRYYPRDPSRLDVGVLPWVSMADALGVDGLDVRIQGNQRPGGVEYHSRSALYPAPTVTGSGLSGYHVVSGGEHRMLTIGEAMALQSFPDGFWFDGSKAKQFLQVGNAVPPLLAEAVLKTFL